MNPDAHPMRRSATSQHAPRRGATRLLAVVVIVALSGCAAPVGVQKISALKAQRQASSNILSTGELSEAARILLRRTNQSERWNDDPEAVLEWLHALVIRPGRRLTAEIRSELVGSVAELAFAHAMKTGDRRYFLAASLYAWLYLLPAENAPRPSVLNRNVRLCADIYNRGLTRALTDPESGEVVLRDETLELPFGTLEVDVDETSLRWGPHTFSGFASLADLEVRGIANRYRIAGIGAPLAARIAPPKDESETDIVYREIRAPVTAVLEFEHLREDLPTGEIEGRISVVAYADSATGELAGRTVTLESEPTAALALYLTEVPPWRRELRGLFQGDLALGRLGIQSLAPYRSGRIPVVLVHGTASSAGRWADLLNDLQSDAVIRRRFQFWFFTYNTGNPIVYSGWLLRKALADTVQQIDPEGLDPALRDMVVIGHSQGGLLTKLLTVDSGRKFWDLAIDRPPDEIELEPRNRELLEGSLLVEPSPVVERVVFLSTPHRGSGLANMRLAQMLGRMIRTPANIVDAVGDAFRDDPEAEIQSRLKRGAGSIGNMSPNNGFIKTLAELPIAPGIHAHSIIGVKDESDGEDGTDGVVDYRSAHLADVESELVVKSGHSSQSNPLVVGEVHRILLEHLAEAIEDGIVEDLDLRRGR